MFHMSIDKNLLLIQISTTIDFPLFFHGLLWCALLMILILNRSTCFMCLERDFKTTQRYCYSDDIFVLMIMLRVFQQLHNVSSSISLSNNSMYTLKKSKFDDYRVEIKRVCYLRRKECMMINNIII